MQSMSPLFGRIPTKMRYLLLRVVPFLILCIVSEHGDSLPTATGCTVRKVVIQVFFSQLVIQVVAAVVYEVKYFK